MITTYDVRWACDVLRPVYDATDGVDGRVSIEVDPRLAHDTEHDHRRGQGAVVAGRPAEPVHQDPGHQAEGLPAITAGARRGHQRQRHADLLARALRRGHGRVPDRPGAGQGQRPRPVRDRLGGVVLRLPRRHRDRQAARQDRHRRGQGAARQGRDRQRPARLRGATRRSSPPTAGRRWPPPAPSRSGRCGPRPASRTPRTTTPCTSIDLVAPGTVNTMPEATLDAVADHGEIRGDTVTATYDAGRSRCSTRLAAARHRLRRRRAGARGRGRGEVRGRPGTSCSSMRPDASSSGSPRRRSSATVERHVAAADRAAGGGRAGSSPARRGRPTALRGQAGSPRKDADAVGAGGRGRRPTIRLGWLDLPRDRRGRCCRELARAARASSRRRHRPRRAGRHGRLVARPRGHLPHRRRPR